MIKISLIKLQKSNLRKKLCNNEPIFNFAEKINHPWFKKLNLGKIDLGSGKRVVFENGILDKKYNITVPKDESYEEI